MCRFVKCCVSFVLALALSFVSLVPCFASVASVEDTTVNTDESVCSVGIGEYLYPGELWDYFLVPTSGFYLCSTGFSVNSSVAGLCPFSRLLLNFFLSRIKLCIGTFILLLVVICLRILSILMLEI